MDGKNTTQNHKGCGCSKAQDAKKVALESKRQNLINKILMRRQKESPVYKTRNKLFL